MASLQLRTPEEAALVVEHFNGFHDGFIRSLSLRSHDRFTVHGPEVTDIGHDVTGEFDVAIEFAHYNYDYGTQPPDRVVRAVFGAVRDFHLDLREVRAEEWPIMVVELPGLPGPEPRFSFTITWAKLLDGRWTTRRATLFTFAYAEFTETTTGEL